MSPQNLLALFVRELEKYARFDDDDVRELVELPARLRRLDTGAYLVREGDVPTHCSILLDGFAYRQKVTGEGSRQILAVCIPGDAIDFQNMFLDISDHGVQTLNRALVADIPREDLQRLVLSRPAIGSAVMHMTLIEASIMREWVVNVGRRDSRARIAHLLCEMALRLKNVGASYDGAGFDFPLTQEQLADATGLTSVHTNRTLQSLRRDGLIKLNSRALQVLDWDGLKKAGDFDELYLHQRL